MANSIAKLAIQLTADTTGLTAGFAKAKAMTTGLAGSMNSMGGGAGGAGMFAGLAAGITPVTAGIAALGAAVAGGTWATKLAADAQSMQASFETMLGSAQKAGAMMSDIQSFAASTPFESGEIAAAAKSLMAFGVSQEQVIPNMRMLGDLASGLGINIGELAQIYGKAKVQGRLFAEDMNQLQGRGIPVVQALAKNFGVGEDKIRGMVEAGQVGFPQLQAALHSLTKQGSMFGGAMEKQSQTFWGQWSTLMDNLKIAFAGVGKMFIGTLTEMLKLVNSALDSWNKFWGNTPKNAGKFAPLDMKLIEEGMKPAVKAVDAVKEAADAAAKAMEALNKQGQSLADSLRTPAEKFVDDVRQFQKLFDANAITGETFARAMAKAREELRGGAKSAEQIRDSLRQQQGGPVAALQFGTQSAISAIATSQREQKLQVEVERAQLAEARKLNEMTAKLLQEARKDTGVKVTEVNL